jgi:hypothetical protein
VSDLTAARLALLNRTKGIKHAKANTYRRPAKVRAGRLARRPSLISTQEDAHKIVTKIA